MATVGFVSAEVLENPAISPPADVIARLHFTEDLGEANVLYTDAWARVKGD